MKTKEIKAILIVLNQDSLGFKYPIGNKELTEKVKTLENQGLIKYNSLYQKWEQCK